MDDLYIDSVQKFNDFYGFETLHPLVSVVRYDKQLPVEELIVHYGVYALFLKENKGCKLSYGRTKYDFDEMTVTSFAPGQNIHVEPNPEVPNPKWTALLFHPDLLARTQLGRQISHYEFFSYSSNEALHLSTGEIEIFRSVLAMIQQELKHAIDKHSRELIVSNIELLLNYCMRFYDRQFITREEINHATVQKFESLLNDYIDKYAETEGIPTVGYFAEKCNLTAGYFGELVKVETGETAQDFIADHIVQHAKELLNNHTLSITQVSDRLGVRLSTAFHPFFQTENRQDSNGIQSSVSLSHNVNSTKSKDSWSVINEDC